MRNRRGNAPFRAEWYDNRAVETSPGPVRDFQKADRFVQEFEEMDRHGKVPNFMLMSLGENHIQRDGTGGFHTQGGRGLERRGGG